MTRRLRIAHVIVQPVLVWDDGENLAPGPQASQAVVALADLDGLADRLRADLAAQAPTDPPMRPAPMPMVDNLNPPDSA